MRESQDDRWSLPRSAWEVPVTQLAIPDARSFQIGRAAGASDHSAHLTPAHEAAPDRLMHEQDPDHPPHGVGPQRGEAGFRDQPATTATAYR